MMGKQLPRTLEIDPRILKLKEPEVRSCIAFSNSVHMSDTILLRFVARSPAPNVIISMNALEARASARPAFHEGYACQCVRARPLDDPRRSTPLHNAH